MEKSDLEKKIEIYFGTMSVYKNLKLTKFFEDIKLPTFMRDWVLRKFQTDNGAYDFEKIKDFVKRRLPNKKDWNVLQDKILTDQETVKILAKIRIHTNIEKNTHSFELPDYGLMSRDTIIYPGVWEEIREEVLKNDTNSWGMVELYRTIDENDKNKISLRSFSSFKPYEVNLEKYKDIRNNFNLDEWIDCLLTGVDYNPNGYSSRDTKLAILTRVLPFLENRLNLIELAPKGTGKSYIYGNISSFGFLQSGGSVTRAKMFYDFSKKEPGMINNYDFLVLDELQSVSFQNVGDLRAALKGYLENGKWSISGQDGRSDCSFILSGNISQDLQNKDGNANLFSELPEDFRESALIDRFHGIIKGWDIPRMNDDLKCCGIGVNTEYITSIFHELRSDLNYRTVVDELLYVPENADTRDTEAIKRLCTAYLKLLFPNVNKPIEINPIEFETYCLQRARNARSLVKKQLGLLDVEFKNKPIPNITLKTEYR